jgi:1-deoxy-D-xylulose-5-phosphate synthase
MELVARLVQTHEALITVEQGAMGGFGAMVLQAMAREGLLDLGCKVRTMCLPDRFIDQASPAEMYRAAGLDTSGIVAEICRVLGRDPKVVDLHRART